MTHAQTPQVKSDSVSARYQQMWQAPEIEKRIEKGIRENRSGDLQLLITDAQGKPLDGVTVEIEQTSHDFLFGANIFLLGQLKTAEQNKKYEAVFGELFNAATVPFYWKHLEPQPGKLRFAADSEPIYRRPPPDSVVKFCQTKNIYMNGHTLVWDNAKWSIPQWLSPEPAERERLFRQRIKIIAERYGKIIPRWDVLNEACARQKAVPMPEEFEWMAFDEAMKWFPRETNLMINETTNAWYGSREPYTKLIKRLRERGARIGTVGLQFHVFRLEEMRRVQDGQHHTPQHLLAVLDSYQSLNAPLHISEITLPAVSESKEAREAQTTVTRNFYRLWFSHPSVNSITWWNVVDGAGAAGEEMPSGLLDENCNRKPAYDALDQLINQEWKTCAKSTAKNGEVKLRAFYGTYKVRINGIEKTFQFNKTTAAPITIQLP